MVGLPWSIGHLGSNHWVKHWAKHWVKHRVKHRVKHIACQVATADDMFADSSRSGV